MHKISFYIPFCFFTFNIAIAQDPYFSQFYANPLYTNPAFAGTATVNGTAAGRTTFNYRNQWNGLIRNFAGSFDQPIDVTKGAIGVQYVYDNLSNGLQKRNEIKGIYATKFTINEKLHLRVGIQGGLVNQKLATDRFHFHDSEILKFKPSINYAKFNTGFLLSANTYYLGLTIHNLISTNKSVFQGQTDYLLRIYSFHGAYYWNIKQRIQLVPQFLVTQPESIRARPSITLGSLVESKYVFGGFWVFVPYNKISDWSFLALNIGAKWMGFKINYSYNFTNRSFTNSNWYSHEISLRYCWKTRQAASTWMRAAY